MAKKYVVLCSKQLERILRPENESAPEADSSPVVAGHVLGTYASAEVAERAIMAFNCPGKHYIAEAMHFTSIEL